ESDFDNQNDEEAGTGSQVDADEEGTEKPPMDPDREREIWESVREEHFEVVEQLPLTLHRQFTLLKELDQQSQEYMEEILPTLKRYIALRRDLDGQYESRRAAEQQKASLQELETSNNTKMAETSGPVPMDIGPLLKRYFYTNPSSAPSTDSNNHAYYSISDICRYDGLKSCHSTSNDSYHDNLYTTSS
ncbi:hypothetical protein MPER_00928, partial [Moniliophthora perniciosa FA553]